VTNHEAIIMLR